MPGFVQDVTLRRAGMSEAQEAEVLADLATIRAQGDYLDWALRHRAENRARRAALSQTV